MFKIGDRVKYRISGSIGVITEKHEGIEYPYVIIWCGDSHSSIHSPKYLVSLVPAYYQDFQDKIKDRLE